MKKPPVQPTDPNIVAALHRAGAVWRGLIASTRPGRPSILASEDFFADRIGRLDDWLTEHHAASVLCVLPAASVICRTCPLPDAAPEQLEQALRLQAEAHLLGISQPHRLAMAVLPNAAGETTRTGLIFAWPETAEFDPPPTTRPITFVPDVAAIAALLNGQRPTEPILWLDRADGSIALAMTHTAGAVFRGTREDSASLDSWRRSVGRVVAETALSVGHSGGYIESLVSDAQQNAATLGNSEAALFAPQALFSVAAGRIQGCSGELSWWSRYGVAAGALLARCGPLAPLTQLQKAPPSQSPSRVRSVLEAMSRPRTATTVAVACVLILMLGPLLFSGMRLMILKVRFGDIDQQLAAATAAKHQLSMYKELQNQKTWPMTKLLADITTNTPLGIELEMIRIEGGKDFAVGGTAIANDKKSPMDIVAEMQDNLRKDSLFSDIVVNVGNANNLGMYKFDLTAKVNKPYSDVKYPRERDFDSWPYVVRLYPQAATSQPAENALASASAPKAVTVVPTAADEDPGTEEDPPADGLSTRMARPTDGEGADFGDASSLTDRESGVAPSQDIPEPLTEEQIKAMQLPELQQALHKVASARKNVRGDEELSARLKKEFEMLMTQMRKAKSSS